LIGFALIKQSEENAAAIGATTAAFISGTASLCYFCRFSFFPSCFLQFGLME
jgi:hypothetical protein